MAKILSDEIERELEGDAALSPELKRIMIMDIGGPHTFRVIYMDGRPHPREWFRFPKRR